MKNKQLILEVIELLVPHFTRKKLISVDDEYNLVCDLFSLLKEYINENVGDACKYIVRYAIPYLQTCVGKERNAERLNKLYNMLKECYCMAGRRSLEHFIIFYEWDWDDEVKLLENRYNILIPYVYYLNKLAFDPNLEFVLCAMPSGWGKLITNQCPILTKEGWKKHGDLTTKDYVLSPNGKWVKVLQIHPKGFANVEVIFSDGDKIKCHNNHEWYLYDRSSKKTRVVETNELLQNVPSQNRGRYYLPFNEYLIGEEKNLPVDPYTYGVWLGDGTNKKPAVTLPFKDKEVIDNIPYTISAVDVHPQTEIPTYYFKNLRKDLQQLGLCYSNKTTPKYIHEMYLTASVEQRLELLAGLLDTDGYLKKDEHKYEFDTCEESLKDTFVELCATFNWRCCVTERQPRLSSSGIQGRKVVYQISFRPDCYIPCRLERKQLKQFSKKQRISVVDVRYLDKFEEGNCITVEGGLYCVGKKLKVTHNSRIMKYYEAWRFGVQSEGCIIALCSNDDLVKSLSRSVIDIIKNEEYAKVFPHLNYKENRRIFTKETDGEWKLNTASLASSYLAKSRDANIVGTRASLSIDIDDMYADSNEALDMALHKRLWDKFNTVILARFIRNKKAQVVMSGTMWSPYDLVCQVIQWQKSEKKFIDDPKFKYCEIAEDGSVAIIRIPALDFETDESTCPNIESTEKLRNIRDRISPYLWQCNFQQNPIPPEGLDFDWEVLTTYTSLPDFEFDPQFKGRDYAFATLDPARKGKNYVSMPIFKRFDDTKYILIDTMYKKRAMNELYDLIVEKIIQHHIIKLVLENNIDTSLKKVIEDKLHEKGVYFCEIIEKYSLGKKEDRIKDMQGIMRNMIIYPDKSLLSSATDMFKFMEHFTTYSFEFPNRYDDAPDSLAMFASEIIEDKSSRNKSTAISRRTLGI